jgi:hypothetical protein
LRRALPARGYTKTVESTANEIEPPGIADAGDHAIAHLVESGTGRLGQDRRGVSLAFNRHHESLPLLVPPSVGREQPGALGELFA